MLHTKPRGTLIEELVLGIVSFHHVHSALVAQPEAKTQPLPVYISKRDLTKAHIYRQDILNIATFGSQSCWMYGMMDSRKIDPPFCHFAISLFPWITLSSGGEVSNENVCFTSSGTGLSASDWDDNTGSVFGFTLADSVGVWALAVGGVTGFPLPDTTAAFPLLTGFLIGACPFLSTNKIIVMDHVPFYLMHESFISTVLTMWSLTAVLQRVYLYANLTANIHGNGGPNSNTDRWGILSARLGFHYKLHMYFRLRAQSRADWLGKWQAEIDRKNDHPPEIKWNQILRGSAVRKPRNK